MYITTAKRVCDICGKKIRKHGWKLSEMALEKTGNIFKDVYRYSSRKTTDMCPACSKEIVDIIKTRCKIGTVPIKKVPNE
jgi:hypothetical protein